MKLPRICPSCGLDLVAGLFWNNVDRTQGCWLWKGGKNERGYGKFTMPYQRDKRMYAHRFSFLLTRGEIPDGLLVLHSCDNPSCVRPEHLRLGSAMDNSRDAVQRGRHRHGVTWGESVTNRKLNWSQVQEIRAKYVPRKVTHVRLAEQYGVSTNVVKLILNGRAWQKPYGVSSNISSAG